MGIVFAILAALSQSILLMTIVFLKEKVAKKDYAGFVLIVTSVRGISYLTP